MGVNEMFVIIGGIAVLVVIGFALKTWGSKMGDKVDTAVDTGVQKIKDHIDTVVK